MSNVIQIRDTQGNALYPITDASLVIGLQDGPFSEYVVSWNGSSTPTVANIPAGVVVTYNGTNYTGTMAASASTACKVYLVASTTQSGEYDRYITTHTGSTYAWTALGSTQIQSPVVVDNLTTNDATKALSAKQGKILGENVGQLEAKLIEITGFGTSGAEGGATTDGDIYYNTSTKLLRKRIDANTYETIPYYEGAIYTCYETLYIWNGTDLVPADSPVREDLQTAENGINQLFLDSGENATVKDSNKKGLDLRNIGDLLLRSGHRYTVTVNILSGSVLALYVYVKKKSDASTIETFVLDNGATTLSKTITPQADTGIYYRWQLASDVQTPVEIEVITKDNDADIDVIQNDLASLTTKFNELGYYNVCPKRNGGTYNSLTFTPNDDGYSVTGTSDGAGEFDIYGNNNVLPDGISSGRYFLNYISTDSQLTLEIFAYVSGTPSIVVSTSVNKYAYITFPAGMSGLIIRVSYEGGKTINGDFRVSLTKSYVVDKTVIDNINSEIEEIGSVNLRPNTPEYYGAIGDGVADDTTAISTMLGNGLKSYEFRNTYKISGLDVPDRDVEFYGNGRFIVTGLGLVFHSPQKHKVIRDLSFQMLSSATFAIRTDGKPADTGICTLKIDNVSVYAPQMSTKTGIYLQGETSALLSNLNLEGCGIAFINCTNPSVDNLVVMYSDSAIYNGFLQDGYGTTEPYACGLNIHNATVIGNRIGIKVVCVDSIIISESMFDFNDYPVVILGSEEPKLLSSYFSSRQGNPVVWMDKNNSDTGVFGGNGLSTEEMHHVSVQDCVLIQYNETLANPVLHLGNCEYGTMRDLNFMYAGKACIELKNARNITIDGVIGNTLIDGAKCLISYDANGDPGDDSSNYYTNFRTALPIYTKFAKAEIFTQSYVTRAEGTAVIGSGTSSITRQNVCPQGVERCIVSTNDGTPVTYQESGKDIIFSVGAHASTIRVNWIIWGKKTYENWT